LIIASPRECYAMNSLFNGAQEAMFQDAPSECLAAFNTTLNCDPKVQLLSYDFDRLDWTEADLTTLCTSPCYSSLQALNETVTSSCGSYEFDFNNAELTAVQVVDLYMYKYNMSCLTEIATGSFCLIVEQSWNLTALNQSGTITWPEFTNVTFPNFVDNDDGAPSLDLDDNPLDESNPSPRFNDYGLQLELSGQDYYQEGIPLDWQGHGWPTILEYDEYPLEIQCSDCFLAQYKLGIESQWGEVYE
ncbi:hypothetical protein BO99DRAFT_314610, partial [Aspergillus violaceofuscus CBS 115571]